MRNFSTFNEIRILEFLSDAVSFELGLLYTIGYFVIYLSKKVVIFTEVLSDAVSFELGLLYTIGYFVIYLSKKVVIFTEIVLKTIN